MMTIVNKLKDAYLEFSEPNLSSWQPEAVAARGFMQVFTPESIVCRRELGKIGTDMKIIQPTIMDGKLMYQVEFVPKFGRPQSGKHWVLSDYLEPSADAGEWDYAWWNAETEEYENPPNATDNNLEVDSP